MKIETLQKEGTLITTLNHEEIKDFLMETMNDGVRPIYTFFSIYMIAVMLGFIWMAGTSIYYFYTLKDINFILPMAIGALISFTILIIIHELIHAIAYYIVGGRKIYFGSEIRKFVFYAASDQEVYNGRQFLIVALAPFIVVNIICLMLYFVNPALGSFYLTILAMHSLFCSGDFIFLNFVSRYKLTNFYTYDDRATKKSFYYTIIQE